LVTFGFVLFFICSCLESQPFSVVELRVAVVSFQSIFEIFDSLLVITLVQVDISPVEIVDGVVGVIVDGVAVSLDRRFHGLGVISGPR